MYVKAKKNELVRLKNERVCVEVGEKCGVCGKAIHFFVYSQGQFNEYQTIALNDTPLLMEWIDDRLFLQYKDRLVEMRCTDRSILSENRTAVKNAAQLCLKVLSNDALLFASSPNILISSHSVS